MDDDLVLIKTRLVGDRLAGVPGSPREGKGLGLVEGGAVSSLDLLVGVDLWSEIALETCLEGLQLSR